MTTKDKTIASLALQLRRAWERARTAEAKRTTRPVVKSAYYPGRNGLRRLSVGALLIESLRRERDGLPERQRAFVADELAARGLGLAAAAIIGRELSEHLSELPDTSDAEFDHLVDAADAYPVTILEEVGHSKVDSYINNHAELKGLARNDLPSLTTEELIQDLAEMDADPAAIESIAFAGAGDTMPLNEALAAQMEMETPALEVAAADIAIEAPALEA